MIIGMILTSYIVKKINDEQFVLRYFKEQIVRRAADVNINDEYALNKLKKDAESIVKRVL